MVNWPELIKKIHAHFICKHLPELRDGLRCLASRLAIIVKKYRYITIGVSLALAVGILFLLSSGFEEKTILLIAAFISAVATITVGFAALHANNNIAETSSQFLKKHEDLLSKAVKENIRQNEIVLRDRLFNEVSIYHVSINELYRLFLSVHYPYKLNMAFCEYNTSSTNCLSIEDIRFINFIESEKMMTINAAHILMSTRFYFSSIFELLIHFDNYMVKFDNIRNHATKREFGVNSDLCSQYVEEVKTIHKKISHHFRCYINDIECLLNKVDDNSISFCELNVYLKSLSDNKITIRKKLHEEYAKRNANDE